jgi:geranylgeranyl reductase family protein
MAGNIWPSPLGDAQFAAILRKRKLLCERIAMATGRTAQFDLIIVGAGFAGLAAARTTASRGLKVAVIDAKREPGVRLHTTGILVPEAVDELDIPFHFTRRIPGVRLYSPRLDSIDLFSPGYAFFTTRTAELLRWLAEQAEEAGATIFWGTRFAGAERIGAGFQLNGLPLTTRYLVGADGARSRVADCFGLGRNLRFLTGIELELESNGDLDPRFLHCFADSRLAPGYIAWAAPGPDAIQLGLAVRHGTRPDLRAFIAHTESMFGWSKHRIVGRRSGRIPCGGLVERASAPGVLLIGDAAGWVSPMTGGGIRLALHYSRRAGALIADHLDNHAPEPAAELGRELPTFRLKRLMRAALDLAPPNPFIDLALSTAPARRLAERIYFHRRGSRGIDFDAYRSWVASEAQTGSLAASEVPSD